MSPTPAGNIAAQSMVFNSDEKSFSLSRRTEAVLNGARAQCVRVMLTSSAMFCYHKLNVPRLFFIKYLLFKEIIVAPHAHDASSIAASVSPSPFCNFVRRINFLTPQDAPPLRRRQDVAPPAHPTVPPPPFVSNVAVPPLLSFATPKATP